MAACTPPTPGAAAVPCSGHGTCVNTTTLGAWATATGRDALCLCDAGWTGAGDFYDNVVAVDPATGTPYALECATPRMLPQIFYSVALALACVRWIATILAIKTKFETRKQAVAADGAGAGGGGGGAASPNLRSAKSFHSFSSKGVGPMLKWACRDTIVVILMLDAFVCTPLICAGLGLKVASKEERAFGTDIPVTLLFALGTLGVALLFSFSTIRNSLNLLQARVMNPEIVARLAFKFKRNPLLLAAGYVLYASGMPFAMLGVQTNKAPGAGPIQSGEVALLITRGVGMTITHLMVAFQSVLLLSETRTLLTQLAGVVRSPHGGAGAANSGGATTAATRVVAFLEKNNKEMILASIVGIPMYALMVAIPPAWPFQCVSVGFATCISMIKTSSAIDILRARRHANLTRQESNPASSGSAPSPGPGGGSATPAAAGTTSGGLQHTSSFKGASTATFAAGSHKSVSLSTASVAVPAPSSS